MTFEDATCGLSQAHQVFPGCCRTDSMDLPLQLDLQALVNGTQDAAETDL